MATSRARLSSPCDHLKAAVPRGAPGSSSVSEAGVRHGSSDGDGKPRASLIYGCPRVSLLGWIRPWRKRPRRNHGARSFFPLCDLLVQVSNLRVRVILRRVVALQKQAWPASARSARQSSPRHSAVADAIHATRTHPTRA